MIGLCQLGKDVCNYWSGGGGIVGCNVVVGRAVGDSILIYSNDIWFEVAIFCWANVVVLGQDFICIYIFNCDVIFFGFLFFGQVSKRCSVIEFNKFVDFVVSVFFCVVC